MRATGAFPSRRVEKKMSKLQTHFFSCFLGYVFFFAGAFLSMSCPPPVGDFFSDWSQFDFRLLFMYIFVRISLVCFYVKIFYLALWLRSFFGCDKS